MNNMDNNSAKNKSSNGRVNLKDGPNIGNLFAMYDKIPANQCVSYREPTLGQWDETVLSKNYFSKENIQIIQNGIRAGVYNKSNKQYVVGPQDCESLKIVMRSVFLQNSTNNPYNIAQQIADLNQIVLDFCINQVYTEARGYLQYLTDVSTLPTPIGLPTLVSQNDKRNYRMPTWF
jgi:hypothetical protein